MSLPSYRPIKSATYTPPGGSALPLAGLLAVTVIETNPVRVEASDGSAHANNAVLSARTTRIVLRGRDLVGLRAIDRAAQGGVLAYTLVGLNGAADSVEQASHCYSRGLRSDGTTPRPFTCELSFDCVTDQPHAITAS